MMPTDAIEVVTYIALVLVIAVAVGCFYAAMTLFNGDDDDNTD